MSRGPITITPESVRLDYEAAVKGAEAIATWEALKAMLRARELSHWIPEEDRDDNGIRKRTWQTS